VAEAAPSVLLAVEQLRRKVPGGIGIYARGLLAGLRRGAGAGDDVAVTLLASRPPRGFPDPLATYGRPVVASALPGRLMTRAWDHALLRAPEGFSVVHSVSLAAPTVRAASRSRLVVMVHDLAWRRHPEATTRRGRRWHEAALRRARDCGADLVVPSRLVAADLVAWGVDETRITVVRGGTDHLVPPDEAATTALLRQLGVRGEYLLTVGTLEPRKNLDRLAQAFHRARPQLPEPWPLVVVGPTGWGHRARPRDVEGVVFTGPVSDGVLSALYGRARAFAYVPLTEGYGLPPLEAMRMGTPAVVSSEVPSVYDLDETGAAPARVVDPYDVEDMAAGLLAVLTDDTLRDDLAARGASFASARTWGAVAEAHVRLWTGLP
jgi:glycosyltransferase involved in cell wall biosynthesis